MKTICIILAVITLPFSCNFLKNDSNAISGTYVRVIQNELYTLYDTVHFTPASKQATDAYLITQQSRTQFKKPADQKYNKQARHSFAGAFDSEKGVMTTPDPGILYAFDLNNGTATINNIRYQKIK